MAIYYSEFTLARVKKVFGLTTSEDTDILAAVPELECSEYLAETLQYNVPLALASNNGKASSREFIVSRVCRGAIAYSFNNV